MTSDLELRHQSRQLLRKLKIQRANYETLDSSQNNANLRNRIHEIQPSVGHTNVIDDITDPAQGVGVDDDVIAKNGDIQRMQKLNLMLSDELSDILMDSDRSVPSSKHTNRHGINDRHVGDKSPFNDPKMDSMQDNSMNSDTLELDFKSTDKLQTDINSCDELLKKLKLANRNKENVSDVPVLDIPNLHSGKKSNSVSKVKETFDEISTNIDPLYQDKHRRYRNDNKADGVVFPDSKLEKSDTPKTFSRYNAESEPYEYSTPDRENPQRVTTPNTVRRRKLIDKNIHLDNADYSMDDDFYKSDRHKLNYSYSNVDSTDTIKDILDSSTNDILQQTLATEQRIQKLLSSKYRNKLSSPGNAKLNIGNAKGKDADERIHSQPKTDDELSNGYATNKDGKHIHSNATINKETSTNSQTDQLKLLTQIDGQFHDKQIKNHTKIDRPNSASSRSTSKSVKFDSDTEKNTKLPDNYSLSADSGIRSCDFTPRNGSTISDGTLSNVLKNSSTSNDFVSNGFNKNSNDFVSCKSSEAQTNGYDVLQTNSRSRQSHQANANTLSNPGTRLTHSDYFVYDYEHPRLNGYNVLQADSNRVAFDYDRFEQLDISGDDDFDNLRYINRNVKERDDDYMIDIDEPVNNQLGTCDANYNDYQLQATRDDNNRYRSSHYNDANVSDSGERYRSDPSDHGLDRYDSEIVDGKITVDNNDQRFVVLKEDLLKNLDKKVATLREEINDDAKIGANVKCMKGGKGETGQLTGASVVATDLDAKPKLKNTKTKPGKCVAAKVDHRLKLDTKSTIDGKTELLPSKTDNKTTGKLDKNSADRHTKTGKVYGKSNINEKVQPAKSQSKTAVKLTDKAKLDAKVNRKVDAKVDTKVDTKITYKYKTKPKYTEDAGFKLDDENLRTKVSPGTRSISSKIDPKIKAASRPVKPNPKIINEESKTKNEIRKSDTKVATDRKYKKVTKDKDSKDKSYLTCDVLKKIKDMEEKYDQLSHNDTDIPIPTSMEGYDRYNGDRIQKLLTEKLDSMEDHGGHNYDDRIKQLMKEKESSKEFNDRCNDERIMKLLKESSMGVDRNLGKTTDTQSELGDDKTKEIIEEIRRRQKRKGKTVSESASPEIRGKTKKKARTAPEQPVRKDLMGYDWIAGLLDNERDNVDVSEGLFEELRAFRRVHQGECVDVTFKPTPVTVEDQKEAAVSEILKDTKVLPYRVNERLFTEPIQVGDEVVPDTIPTHDQPRFVRVSIPRSAMTSPHVIKPHRRRSFDATDAVSLRDHCMLGWQNSRPAALPTAETISLKGAIHGQKTSITTTLDEAVKIADSFYRKVPERNEYVYAPERRIEFDSILNLKNTELLEACQNRRRYDASVNATGDSLSYHAETSTNTGKSLGENTKILTDLTENNTTEKTHDFSTTSGNTRDKSVTFNTIHDISTVDSVNDPNFDDATSDVVSARARNDLINQSKASGDNSWSVTDSLLTSTYSIIYELQRLRKERENGDKS